MSKQKLDPQEQKVARDFDSGELVGIKNLKKEKELLMRLAKANLKKDKNINIRLSESVLLKLKSRAAENGIAYQTLVSTILYQYANEKFKLSV